jgi:hypothetical protein
MVDGGRTPGRQREKGDRRLTVGEGSVRAVSVEERRGRKVTGVNEGVRGRSDGGGGGGGG